MNELLATYYILHRTFNVYGCYDKDTPEGEFDFYDVYEDFGSDKPSFCINDGDPFDEMPSRDDVKEFVEENNL